MDPQEHELLRVRKLRRLRGQEASEHAAHVPDIELVMEVGRCFPEGGHDGLVQAQSRLDDARHVLGHGCLEGQALEVALHERGVNHVQGGRLREGDGARPEVPLQAWVHDERARGGVHARHVLCVANVLQGDLVAVPPMVVILLLLQKLNGALRVVFVQSRHVQVVDEINHPQLPRRRIQLARLLLERALHHGLQQCGVGVEAHVHGEEHECVRRELPQQPEARLRLAATCQSNEHDGMAHPDEGLHDEAHGSCLIRRHSDIAHGRLAGIFDLVDESGPLLELRLSDEVIENRTFGRVLDRFHLALPPVAELLPVVHAVNLGETEAARRGKTENEPILDHLVLVGRDQGLQKAATSRDHVDVHHGHQYLGVLQEPIQSVVAVLLEVFVELLLHCRGVLLLLDPALHVRAPLHPIDVAHADDAGARGRGGRGVVQVADLEDHLHVRLQGDALVGRQRQQTVVVHHAVHGLDPIGVQVTVQHDPLRVRVGDLAQVAHHL
mmetsp:Transcript_39918/g.120622  ORF Transcript_39918/g.120622 Transcript_39918/m.120622 type:complete len:497 (+) Transcript_39918:1506-2996(+)